MKLTGFDHHVDKSFNEKKKDNIIKTNIQTMQKPFEQISTY